MSADGGHLGWRFGSLDIILKVDHLRTIHAMFALNWLTGFRGEDFKHFFHRALLYVKIKSRHGGHLEFPISKRFTSLVQDHPMIIPAKSQSQFKWFLTRRFLKFWPIRTHYGPWQPCWISDQRQKQISCIWPSNENFCQVWFKSVLWFQKKRWKCEIPIGSNVMVAILNLQSAIDSHV